jgi:hypothetical protein
MQDPIQVDPFLSELPEDPARGAPSLHAASDPVEAFLESREIGTDFQVPGGVIRVETRIKVSRSPWSVRSVVLENGAEIQGGPFAPVREEHDPSMAEPETLDDMRLSFAKQALEGHQARCRQVERALSGKAPKGEKREAEIGGGKSGGKGALIAAAVLFTVLVLGGGAAYLLGPGKKLLSGWNDRKGTQPAAPAAPIETSTTPVAATTPEPTPTPASSPAMITLPQSVQALSAPAAKPSNRSAPKPASSISTRPRPTAPDTARASVPSPRDLIRIVEPSGYALGTLKAGGRAYVDDSASFAEIPAALRNLRCIRTANEDRTEEKIVVSFNVRQDGQIYIAHDRRLRKKPDWLKPFSRTAQPLAVTEADGERVLYDVFVRDVAAGSVILGSNTQWNAITRKLRGAFPKDIKMYFVCVQPSS